MVTLDFLPGAFGEVLGEPFTPGCEVREDKDAFVSCEYRVDDLVQPGEFSASTFKVEVLVFFVVVQRVVAYLFQGCNGRKDQALLLAGVLLAFGGISNELVEDSLVQSDCSGVIVQWASSSIQSGSSAAIAGSDLVRRNTRTPLRACSADSAAPTASPTAVDR